MDLDPQFAEYVDLGLTCEKLSALKDALAANLKPRPNEAILNEAVGSILFRAKLYANGTVLSQADLAPSLKKRDINVEINGLRRTKRFVQSVMNVPVLTDDLFYAIYGDWEPEEHPDRMPPQGDGLFFQEKYLKAEQTIEEVVRFLDRMIEFQKYRSSSLPPGHPPRPDATENKASFVRGLMEVWCSLRGIKIGNVKIGNPDDGSSPLLRYLDRASRILNRVQSFGAHSREGQYLSIPSIPAATLRRLADQVKEEEYKQLKR